MLFLTMLYVQFVRGNTITLSHKIDVTKARNGFVDVTASLNSEGWKVHLTYFNRKAYRDGKKDCLSCTYLQGYYTLQDVLEIAKANCRMW